jgi:CDP-6-deoxy-D-xylo-4-hexulose-3-dehydrase
MLRSHGWTRDCSPEWKKLINDIWQTDEFTSKYTFYVPGFNVRNTDIGAFLGLKQLDVLDRYVKQRNSNWIRFLIKFGHKYTYVPSIPHNTVSNFAIPLIGLPDRQRVVDACKLQGIECRPLVAGSMSKQPMVKRFMDDVFYTTNADKLHDSAMYLPNHADITEKEIDFMSEVVRWAI